MVDLPPIWVVSLQRAGDRRALVESAFGDVGLPFEVFAAVDGRALSDADVALYSSRRAHYEYGRDFGRAMLGASLSHLRVLERMMADGLDELAVFEDDVRPSPTLVDVLVARSSLPSDWDILTLHSLFSWAAPTRVGGDPLAGHHWLAEFERTPMGSQGYLIRRAAAQRVLDVGYPVALPPDELLFRPGPVGLRVYGVDPSPLVHVDLPSEIRVELPPVVEHGVAAQLGLRAASLAGRVHRRVAGPWRQRRHAADVSTSDQRSATTERS